MSTPTTVPSDAVTLEPGHLVAGRYLLLARVGRGGSGSVWRAHDELLDRDVAIKRLHGGRALTDVHTRKIRERAHREGRVAARLHHPRLAAIYDMTELDGEVCLVMEYVAAPSLADLLERRGLASRRPCRDHRRPDRRGPGGDAPVRDRAPRRQAGQRHGRPR